MEGNFPYTAQFRIYSGAKLVQGDERDWTTINHPISGRDGSGKESDVLAKVEADAVHARFIERWGRENVNYVSLTHNQREMEGMNEALRSKTPHHKRDLKGRISTEIPIEGC